MDNPPESQARIFLQQTEDIIDVEQSAQAYAWNHFRSQTIFVVGGCIFLSIFFLIIIISSWSKIPPQKMMGILFLPAVPLFPLWIYYDYITRQLQSVFMRQLAKMIGFTYTKNGDISSVIGVCFQGGHDREMHDLMVGTYEGRQMRIFEYSQTVGYGKQARSYVSTVFEFALQMEVAHVVLRPIGTPPASTHGTREVTLEGNFNTFFSLQIPKEFDSEVRVIFTPDIMEKLVEKFRSYRLEILENRLYIVSDRISRRKQFVEAFDIAKYLFDQMLPSIESVGTKKSSADN